MITRKRIWEIIEVAKPGDRASRAFDLSILSLIFLNVGAVTAGSVEEIQCQWGRALDLFEIFSVVVFTFEYLARIWSCAEESQYSGIVKGRLKMALQPMTIIDLLAILPFYLPFLGIDLRSIRVLRLLRIFRVAKVGRYYSSLNLIKQVFSSKKEELVLTSALLVGLLVISASVLYYCENESQKDVFSSIPATMWWSVATLTTVGYGDMYPKTLLGKICASIISVLGIGMCALPTGILGAGFVEAIQKNRGPQTCPHCGKEIV